MKTILQTPRLLLRELDLDDLDFVAALLADPEVMRYWPRTHTREEAEEWIWRHQSRYLEDGCGYWLALDKQKGHPVGQAGLLRHDIDGVSELGLGYIIHRPYWRQGYATEASRGCLRYGFETMKRDSLVALVRPENLPSQGVARKLGMAAEKSTMHAGMEHLVFVLSRRQWSED
jgi:RimJ/RimL family protein N-acetyltransferase